MKREIDNIGGDNKLIFGLKIKIGINLMGQRTVDWIFTV